MSPERPLRHRFSQPILSVALCGTVFLAACDALLVDSAGNEGPFVVALSLQAQGPIEALAQVDRVQVVLTGTGGVILDQEVEATVSSTGIELASIELDLEGSTDVLLEAFMRQQSQLLFVASSVAVLNPGGTTEVELDAQSVPSTVSILPFDLPDALGSTVQLEAEARLATGDIDPDIELVFTSFGPSAASITPDGLMTLNAEAGAVIQVEAKATLDRGTASSISYPLDPITDQVPVNVQARVDRIDLDPPFTQVLPLGEVEIVGTALDSNGNELARGFLWTVDQPSVVELILNVPERATARGLTVGLATVSAESEGVTGTADVEVVSQLCGGPVTGDFVLNDRADLDAFVALGITDLQGSLEVADSDIPVLDLGCLTSVTGSLIIDTNTSLTAVQLPFLTDAGALTILFNHSLTSVDVSSLASAGSLFLIDNPLLSTFTLPVLTSIPNTINVEAMTGLVSLDLGAVSSANTVTAYDNPSLTGLTLSTLNQVGQMVLARNANLVNVALPQLETVTGSIMVEDNPNLPPLQLPQLAQVGGNFTFQRNGGTLSPHSAALPALESADAVRFLENPQLTGLTLPLMTEGQVEAVDNTSLSLLDLPQLITSDLISARDNTNLTTFGVGNLQSAQSFTAFNSPLLTQINLPNLSTAGDLTIQATDISTISLPSLTQGSFFQFSENPSLSSISVPGVGSASTLFLSDLPALAAVNVSGLTSLSQDLWLYQADQLVTFQAPNLQSVAGQLVVHDNPLLVNLDFPSLTTAGRLTIEVNPALPDLNGFTSLASGLETLTVQTNSALTDVSGLSNLGNQLFADPIFTDRATFQNNPNLCDQDVTALVDGLDAKFPGNMATNGVVQFNNKDCAGPSELAYVVNNGSQDVSIVDLGLGTVVETMPLFSGDPGGIAIGPDDLAYVIRYTANDVQVLDLVAREPIASISVGSGPVGGALAPNNLVGLVANEGSNDVSVVDLPTLTVLATVAVGSEPQDAEFGPGTLAYVPNFLDDDVAVIDLEINSVVANIGVGSTPAAIGMRPDRAFAYTANLNSDNVSVINTGTNQVVATIPMGDRPIDVVAWGGFGYVPVFGDNQLTVFDTNTNLVVTSINVGTGPVSVALSRDANFVLVANRDSNDLSVIDIATNTVVQTIAVGITPTGVAARPPT